MMDLCRLCLTSDPSLTPILYDNTLQKRIKDCVSVEINDTETYSTSVCSVCVEKVNTWHDFKLMCLKSQSLLLSNNATLEIEAFTELAEAESQSSKETVNECEFCLQTFQYYTDYIDHQGVHNGKAIFSCDNCKLTFSNKQLLVDHEKRHKITCHVCGTKVQKQSIKLHLNKHTDRFKCSECLLTFSCATFLKNHIASRHHKVKQHFCDTCGKNFATKSSLILHLKTHSDLKEYKCTLCDYAGRTSISLRIHMSKHERGTYICEYCSKIFKSIRNLRDHLRRVHQCNKKFSCDLCQMKFALRYLLEQHKRTHTGMHPYKCSKCDKTFARSDGLKEHSRIHGNAESFQCEMCSKVFRTKRGLKRHNCPSLNKKNTESIS